MRENLAPERNHRTLELYALFVAALALPELDRDGLLDFAVVELDRNLATDFRADGVHREASTHYHLIALRSFVGARVNALRFGVELPDGFDERLARACAFAVHCTRPDGTIPALSDADTGDYRPLLAQAAAVLGDETLRPLNASFPDGGYFVQRSGWAPDDRFLIFDCGPLGDGGHGHYDLLSFEAHGGGRPLVVDPGRGSYSEAPPNLRRWFRGTAAHNTVCVDGLDQTPYTRGRPSGAVAHGRLLWRREEPGLDVLAGEARSPVYEAVHERRIAFVRGEYWVIEDRLRGDREHVYDLRFHLAPGVERLDGERWRRRVDLARGTVTAPGLALVVLGAERVGIEPGWVAPSYGRLLDAPVVSAVATGTHARFVSVLVPGDRAPRSQPRRHPRARRRRGGGAVSALLAPDPAVPQRDALLDERRMAALLGPRLTGDPAARCERVNAKYRVGDSLRVAYRIEGGGRSHTVACRTFAGRSGSVYRRAAAAATPAGGIPAVLHEPELETVFWTFPNDRRLDTLRLLDGPSEALDQLLGRRGVRARLVAYAPERSATARCASRDGRVLAYVKLHWDALDRERAAAERAYAAIGPEHPRVRTPRVLAVSEPHRALVLEPLPGRRLDRLPPAGLAPALRALGAALASLHQRRAAAGPPLRPPGPRAPRPGGRRALPRAPRLRRRPPASSAPASPTRPPTATARRSTSTAT